MLDYCILEIKGVDIYPKFPFTGSTIRGSFGTSLKSVICQNPCSHCPFTKRCAYFQLFESTNETPNFKLDINFAKNSYDFAIYLFNEAILYLPTILKAVLQMRNLGLGVDRNKFNICDILLDGLSIFDGKNTKNFILSYKKFSPTFMAGSYQLRTISPLRIKQNNKFITNSIDFKLFIRQIAMRYSKMIGQEIAKFEVKFSHFEYDLSPYKLHRYSNRQCKKMEFDGVMGEMIVYDLDEISAKFLELATIIGAGKSTTFGLGKLDIKPLQKGKI